MYKRQDNDGVLELLLSHGESGAQPLTLFKYHNDEQRSFLRVRPLNIHGAPARGATVTLYTNERTHSKTIDAGSGYLCQMEPVAHYGIRDNENEFKIKIKWTNGYEELFEIENLTDDIKEAYLLVECPRILFPFARRIIYDLHADGSLPPLMLDPVNFAELYKKKKGKN